MDIKISIPNNELDSLLTSNKILNYLLMFTNDNDDFLTQVEKTCIELKNECKDIDLFDEFKRCYLGIPIGLRKQYLQAIIHKNVTDNKQLSDDHYGILKRIVRRLGIDTGEYDLFGCISDQISERIIATYGNKYSDVPEFILVMVDENKDEEIRKLIDMLDSDHDIKKFIIDNNIDDSEDRIKVFKAIILFLRSNHIRSQ